MVAVMGNAGLGPVVVVAARVESTTGAVVVVVLGESVGMALVGPTKKVVVGEEAADVAAAGRGKARTDHGEIFKPD
jgi:hypothetical protein